MKKSFFIKFMALAVISAFAVTALSAKPNTKAATYKPYEMICFYLPVDVVLLSDGIRGQAAGCAET